MTGLGNLASLSTIQGTGPASYSLFTSRGEWGAAPQTTQFSMAGVVNAASFTGDIPPGGIITVFGAGLAQANSTSTVQVDGAAVNVVAQSPFQLSAVLPLDLQPGSHSLTITSPFGTVTQPMPLVANAPEIFTITGSQGAI